MAFLRSELAMGASVCACAWTRGREQRELARRREVSFMGRRGLFLGFFLGLLFGGVFWGKELGVGILEGGFHGEVDFFEGVGLCLSEVVGLVRVGFEVEEFVAAFGGAVVVLGELPVALSKGGEVSAAVMVGEVHEKFLRVLAVVGGEEGCEVLAIDDVVFGGGESGDLEEGGEEVANGGKFLVDDAVLDGEFFLNGGVGVWSSPRGDEGGEHASFVVGGFFAAIGGRGVVFVGFL